MNCREFAYGVVDEDVPVTADIYYNSSTGRNDPAPIAILIYGGGFVAGAKENVSKAIIGHLMDELGFVVVVPNYRHCPTVSVAQGPLRDIRTCYRWAGRELPALLLKEAGVAVEGARTVIIGSSAGGNLALHMAAEVPRPKAIISYFAPIYLEDEFWHSPMGPLSQVPTFPKDFLDRVMNEGTVLATPSSFKKTPEIPTPVPDFSRPRVAWLLSNLRDGTWLRSVVQDADVGRIDPTSLFGSSFPPTCFVHGTEDKMCLPRFSERAHEALLGHGVDSKLLYAEGKGHDFETSLTAEDPTFDVVRESLQFAADRA